MDTQEDSPIEDKVAPLEGGEEQPQGQPSAIHDIRTHDVVVPVALPVDEEAERQVNEEIQKLEQVAALKRTPVHGVAKLEHGRNISALWICGGVILVVVVVAVVGSLATGTRGSNDSITVPLEEFTSGPIPPIASTSSPTASPTSDYECFTSRQS